MQASNIVRLPLRTVPKRAPLPQTSNTRNEWLYPGKVTVLTTDISISIAYDCVDGVYKTRFKFWLHGERIKDITLDERRQINLRETCRCIITQLAQRINPVSRRPEKTLIEIAHVPYSWEV